MLPVFFVFLTSFLRGAGPGYDNGDERACATDILWQIYAGQFAGAEQNLAACATRSDELFEETLLRGFLWRWQYVPIAYSGKKEAYLNLLETGQAEREVSRMSPEAIYVEICRNLFLAEYYSSLNQTWQAFRYAQKMYPYIAYVLEQEFAGPEFLFVRGLYHFYMEYYREKSLFFRLTLLPFREGSKAEGMRLLRLAAQVPSTAQIEAKIFLAHILLRLEKRPVEALPFSAELVLLFPANLKFRELLVDNLLTAGRYLQAEEHLAHLEQSADPYFRAPALYFRGVLENHFRRSAKAVPYFEACAAIDFTPVAGYQRLAKEQLKKLERVPPGKKTG